MTELFNPFTGDFMVTVSDINIYFNSIFLLKIYSKTGIRIVTNYRRTSVKTLQCIRLKQRSKQIQTNCILDLPSILYILSFWSL